MANSACAIVDRVAWIYGYINEAPMRIGTEDPWALTELAKTGGLGERGPPQPSGGLGGTPHLGTFAFRCLGL